jgi:hypothetical protein
MTDPTPFITKAQLEKRLSSIIVKRIYDDDNDGVADTDPLDQLCMDASSKVRGKLGPVYNPDLLDSATVDEIRRITLDQAHAMAAQRFPEVLRIDGFRLMEQADKDLKALRIGDANLGVNGSPEPAANVGGTVTSGDINDPDYPEPKEHFALDGTGSF